MSADPPATAPPRRRASPEIARQKKIVSAALKPVVEDIRAWQMEAAHIEAVVQRLGMSDVAQRHAELLGKARNGRDAVHALVADLPEDVRANSRVVDVVRAIESVVQRLERLVDPSNRRAPSATR